MFWGINPTKAKTLKCVNDSLQGGKIATQFKTIFPGIHHIFWGKKAKAKKGCQIGNKNTLSNPSSDETERRIVFDPARINKFAEGNFLRFIVGLLFCRTTFTFTLIFAQLSNKF